jgi:hypothetical protein
MDIEKLITKVQENPQIYDPQREDYMDRNKRENTFMKIGAELGVSGEYFMHFTLIKMYFFDIFMNFDRK